ncbi:RNA polymerase sigma factor [Sorangium sp. So ce693]|uniref:RNA polymerase sigma factor n=1 Tax=unclassified Sorangium TaxID=2621164 RepID=UPI003F5F70F5
MDTLPSVLRLLGVSEPDIDDLFQEILLAAYESLDRFDPAFPASTSAPLEEADPAGDPPPRDGRRQKGSAEARWVFGIAWRKVSRYLDRAYRRREVPTGLHPAPHEQAVDPAPSSEQRVADRERLELAIAVLGTIAPERRILLVLHEAFDVPVVEIARMLGINYNTACNRLRLAREDYRAAVARLRPEQRQALRACWLLFPLASDSLVRDDGTSASVPPAAPPAPSPPAPPTAPAPAPPAPPPAPPVPPASARPVPPAPLPQTPATSSLRRTLARVGRYLGAVAAGIAGTIAVQLALASPPAHWARRFEAQLPEPPPASSACLAPTPQQQTPEPAPVAPAAEALPRPCPAAPRAAAPAGEREDTFAEELRLLSAARERLSAGDPAGALRLLAAHEARFPAGRLTGVRERLRTVGRARLAPPEQRAPGGAPSR